MEFPEVTPSAFCAAAARRVKENYDEIRRIMLQIAQDTSFNQLPSSANNKELGNGCSRNDLVL
jgi:hypothetical protein